MKNNFIKRIICTILMTVSLLTVSSVGANAEISRKSTYTNQWVLVNGQYCYYGNEGTIETNKWIDGKYYVGTDGVWVQNATVSNTNSNSGIPITVPTTWGNMGNNKYSINNRSVLSYSVSDMTGWTQESVMNDIRKITYQKGNYDSENGLVTYNGNNGYAYSYTSLTKERLAKVLCIVIFKNNKHYDFIFVSDYNNYQTDRKELENVLNTTLNI